MAMDLVHRAFLLGGLQLMISRGTEAHLDFAFGHFG